MGWCSGTDIFDSVVKELVELHDAQILNNDEFVTVVTSLTEALYDKDWDCEADSDYWSHPLVRQVFKELNPNWTWDDED